MIKGILENKTIIITGAFQGIGKQTVKTFAESGANIFACSIPIIDVEKKKIFEDYIGELANSNNVKIYPLYFDMLSNEDVKNAVKEILSKHIEINGLVNIAGINKDAYFGMITEKDLLDTFQVNVFSQIIFSQYIARIMIKNNTGGSIIFTSSVTALDGNEGQVVYGASKAALNGAMKSMAKELGIKGIRVNCIAPGVIKSPMTEKLSKDIIDKKIKIMDINRLGETFEVANLYEFLISDLSSHITGQIIRIDGGM